MARKRDTTGASGIKRYTAPALEKGLDILELLAKDRQPLTISMISQRLGRSTSELFRMVHVLENRGFIGLAENGEGYVPTDRLFSLGMEQAPVKNLIELALPIMRELSTTIGQSCHLTVRSGEDIVVVARMESAEQIGFSVRIGYRKALIETASGAVLFAFQQESVRERWLQQLAGSQKKSELAAFQARAAIVQAKGYERMKSGFMVGVTDVSAPILRGTAAAAALTVPFIQSTPLLMPLDDVIRHLRASAAQISASLLVADHRV